MNDDQLSRVLLNKEGNLHLLSWYTLYPITLLTAHKHCSTVCHCATQFSFDIQSWCQPELSYYTFLMGPFDTINIGQGHLIG